MDGAKVIPIGTITKLDLPVERVLEAAKFKLNDVVIIGWDVNDELYTASSIADGAEVLWLLRKCEQRLMEIVDE